MEDCKLKQILQKIPKWAVVGIAFALTTYLYRLEVIGQPELELIATLSSLFGIAGSTITRLPMKSNGNK